MNNNSLKKRESALKNNSDISNDNYISPEQIDESFSSAISADNANSAINANISQDSIKDILSSNQNNSSIKEHIENHVQKNINSMIKENISSYSMNEKGIAYIKEDIESEKKATEKFSYLKQNDMKKLFKKRMSIRDKLILNVLYETGCTVKEATGIRLSHIDEIKGVIHIDGSKEGKARTAHVSKNLITNVKEFYQEEFDIDDITAEENDSRYLFSTRQSKRITTRRIRQIVKDNCKKIGILDASPKLLRYTHIVHAYENGMPIGLIQEQVGIKRSRAIELFCNLKELDKEREYRLM